MQLLQALSQSFTEKFLIAHIIIETLGTLAADKCQDFCQGIFMFFNICLGARKCQGN